MLVLTLSFLKKCFQDIRIYIYIYREDKFFQGTKLGIDKMYFISIFFETKVIHDPQHVRFLKSCFMVKYDSIYFTSMSKFMLGKWVGKRIITTSMCFERNNFL